MIAQGSKHYRQYLNEWFEVDGVKVKIRNGQNKDDVEVRFTAVQDSSNLKMPSCNSKALLIVIGHI